MRTLECEVTNKYTNETRRITVRAWYGSSRCGFNHWAEVLENGNAVLKTHIHYINRTWEAWPFDTVISCAARRYKEQWERATPRYARPRKPSRKARITAAASNPNQLTLGL